MTAMEVANKAARFHSDASLTEEVPVQRLMVRLPGRISRKVPSRPLGVQCAHLRPARTACQTFPVSGSGFPVGAVVRTHTGGRFLRILQRVGWVFLQRRSGGRGRDGGRGLAPSESPAPPPRRPQLGAGRRATWAGPAPARRRPGAPPRLAVDSSAGAEPLVPVSGVSAWERARAARGPPPPAPAPRVAPGAAPLHVPASCGAPSLPCARRAVSGGAAAANPVAEAAGSEQRSPFADAVRGSRGGKSCCAWHWRFGGKGSRHPRLPPRPGEERPEREGSAWNMEQTWAR